MRDIGLDCPQERLFGTTFEEFDVDGLLTPEQGGQKPVCAIDHTHVGPSDENGGQRAVDFGEAGNMLLVGPL